MTSHRYDAPTSVAFVAHGHWDDRYWANPALLFPVLGAIQAQGCCR